MFKTCFLQLVSVPVMWLRIVPYLCSWCSLTCSSSFWWSMSKAFGFLIGAMSYKCVDPVGPVYLYIFISGPMNCRSAQTSLPLMMLVYDFGGWFCQFKWHHKVQRAPPSKYFQAEIELWSKYQQNGHKSASACKCQIDAQTWKLFTCVFKDRMFFYFLLGFSNAGSHSSGLEGTGQVSPEEFIQPLSRWVHESKIHGCIMACDKPLNALKIEEARRGKTVPSSKENNKESTNIAEMGPMIPWRIDINSSLCTQASVQEVFLMNVS